MSDFGENITRETEIRRPNWEPALNKFVEARLSKADSSHDVLHVARVDNLTLKLGKMLGLTPREIAIAKAVSKGHDIVTYKKNDPRAKKETEESAEVVGKFLQGTNFNSDLISEVKRGIVQSSFTRGEKPEILPAQIVYTADKLDQLGAIGFARYGASSFAMGRELHHPTDPLAELKREMDEMIYAVDAIKKRKPKIAGQLFTSEAKAVGEMRLNRELGYLKDIGDELEEEKKLYEDKKFERIFSIRETGMIFVYRIFEEAGEKGQKFYNPEDPFARNRPLEPNKYPIDRLLASQKQIREGLENSSFGASVYSQIKIRTEKVEKFLQDFKIELELKDFDNLPIPPPTPHISPEFIPQ